MKRKPHFLLAFCIAVLLTLTSINTAYSWGEVKKAKEFMRAGMYPQAITLLDKAINEKPTDAEAHFQLGVCYMNTGNYTGADERFASAVRLKPDLGYKIGHQWKKLAESAISQRYPDKAKELYEKMVQYNPGLKNPKFLQRIGIEYLRMAVNNTGHQREFFKKKAARIVGWDKVNKVFPPPCMKTVFEKTYTDADIDPKRGNIVAFTWGNRFKTGDIVEIDGHVPKGTAEIAIHWCKDCKPDKRWKTTNKGRLSYPIVEVPPAGTYYLVWIEKGKNIKFTLRVSRKITPKPNINLINDL